MKKRKVKKILYVLFFSDCAGVNRIPLVKGVSKCLLKVNH